MMLLLKTAGILLFTSCTKDLSTESNKRPIQLTIRPIAFGAPIDTSILYTNGSGEPFKVRTFKFYISQIELKQIDGTRTIEEDRYHLIDLFDTASQTFTIKMEKGSYDSIRFMIGVDSAHNVSGAQAGALDPVKGMFWTWNTGYIFAKLEGRSPISTAPNRSITYHIGGFRNGENAIRNISLSGLVDVETTSSIELTADIAFWFDGVERIRIANHPSIMTPGPIAIKFADNYAKMFSLHKIIRK